MQVTLQTSEGQIELTLFPEQAPKTVENFMNYVREGHYDGTIFHRVIDGFMVQGGGFTPGMQQKPTRDPIPNEANNGVANKRGTVAMARTQDPHSATAQFFINVNDNHPLNHQSEDMMGWGYCVFGEVTAGMDVVDRIRQVKTGEAGFHQDVPVTDIVLEKATVSTS